MTFADLVAALDKATAPILVVLEKAGPQYMSGPNNTVQVFTRDNSLLGFSLSAASKADQTTVAAPAGTAAAAALAAAKAQIEAAAQGA